MQKETYKKKIRSRRNRGRYFEEGEIYEDDFENIEVRERESMVKC